MIRHAAIAAIAVCLSPSWLAAQSTQFTVSVQTAAVRKAPSVASPVIGQATRGAVLDVTRDIGAWVKVAWPDAQDGVGYVHQSMGSLSRRATMEEKLTAAFAPEPAAPEPAATNVSLSAPGEPAAIPMSTRTQYVAAPTHIVGVGGRMGRLSHDDFGITARVWSRKRLGIQFDASRSALVSADSPGRVTSMHFAPSLIYSLADRVTDNVWVRPYVGAGGTLVRSKLKGGTLDPLTTLSDNSFGFRTFGGGELTFPSVPRFAVSADLGYLWSKEPFPGFDPAGLKFSLSGHWYVK